MAATVAIARPRKRHVRAPHCVDDRCMEVRMTTIRPARSYDADAIAALCGELGYPATRRQVVARLAAIQARGDGDVLVAEGASGGVVGWLQVGLAAQLTGDAEGEVLGLVVAEGARGDGVGARLLVEAERWARTRGCPRMRVRSRVERERAHRFYERAGYARSKTQAVFGKPLA